MTNKTEKTTPGKRGRKTKSAEEKDAERETTGSSKISKHDSVSVVRSNKPTRIRPDKKLDDESAGFSAPLPLEKKNKTPIGAHKPLDVSKPMAKIGSLAAASPAFFGMVKAAPRVTPKRVIPLVLGLVLLSSLAWPQHWLPGTDTPSEEVLVQTEGKPDASQQANPPVSTLMTPAKGKVEVKPAVATPGAMTKEAVQAPKAVQKQTKSAVKKSKATVKQNAEPKKKVQAKRKVKDKDQTKKSLASKGFR